MSCRVLLSLQGAPGRGAAALDGRCANPLGAKSKEVPDLRALVFARLDP